MPPSPEEPPETLPPQRPRRAGDQPTVRADPARRRGEAAARFTPGTLLAGRYRIAGRLGRGGMGEVYRADDLKLGEPVALKFLPQAMANDPAWLARLHDEVRIARQVTHPNVCRVYDIGEIDDDHFISMEYVDGEDLASLLRRIGRLAEDKAVDIARQLCAGLAAAHEKNVLHRDLKPANIMLDGRGKVRITDFGIATPADRVGKTDITTGTPAYMAPEQLAGKEVTKASDVYALGLVLYEIFTGEAVVDTDSIEEIRQRHRSGTPTTPSSLLAGIDPTVERVVLRCLEKEPRQRPSSALAVAAALPGGDPLSAALAAGETPSPDLVAAAGGSEAMPWPAAASCVVLLAAALLVLVPLEAKVSLYGYAPLEKPPAALVDRAKSVLTRIGYAERPADTAFGYDAVWEYQLWSEQQEDAPAREERFRQARPETMVFWYRQSPRRFRPRPTTWLQGGRVYAQEPAWSVPGEAHVSLDLAGRLRRFDVVPDHHHAAPDGERPVASEAAGFGDWEAIFELAGLDLDAFAPAEPRYHSKFRSERRVAWAGVYPEAPHIPLRVEAGELDGRPVYFRLDGPWEWPAGAAGGGEAAPEPTFRKRLADAIVRWDLPFAMTVGMTLLVGAGCLALRNRRLGRSDRRGAARLAAYAFAASLLAIFLGGGRFRIEVPDDLVLALGPPTFIAVLVWLCYLGLEPYVRRQWPTMLVAWTRLLSGRLRDPVVGRSVLVGALFGVASSLLFAVALLGPEWVGRTPPWPKWVSFGNATVMRLPIGRGLLVLPLLLGFIHVLLLVTLRYVLRAKWVAAVVFLAAMPFLFFDDRSVHLMPWTFIAGVLWGGLILVLLLRFGVLAVMVCLFCDMLLWEAPLTPNLTAWYAQGTIVPVGVVAALAAFGAYAATYGRPIPKAQRAG